MIIRKLYKILLILAAGLFICAALGKMAVAASDNATAAGDFLNIGVSARAAGLGGAYTSVADDAAAAYWNPAGLVSSTALTLIIVSVLFYAARSRPVLIILHPLRRAR